MRRKQKPETQSQPQPQRSGASLANHQAQCSICRHPFREAIEEEFVHWIKPSIIAHDYEVDWRPIYRHAHACGLFEKRARNLRFALGHILENACGVAYGTTGGDVVRAAHHFARINDHGQWVEPPAPPAHVIVSSGSHIAQTSQPPQPFAASRRKRLDRQRPRSVAALPGASPAPGNTPPAVPSELPLAEELGPFQGDNANQPESHVSG